MTPERWCRIKEVFGAARERPESQRSDFLDTACKGDAELRAEVEDLLGEDNASSLLSPAADLLGVREYRPGDTIGHYQIEGKLGEGGMGVVYKARDTRLGRRVAVKFVKSQFSSRGQREARVVAALNHPNICTLHDVGPNYLVMEWIEGSTLAERMAQGHMPIEEALTIARQIAAALEAAHEKGVVHRDLKPANIKLTAGGTIKVLDFGLAKVMEPAAAGSQDSPTVTGSATQAGMILGTAGYMSPEQANGKPVDKRADIWSFGVVLWELLTGHRLFEGETVTQTLAAVLAGPIKFERLPRETPPGIVVLLRRCLDRDVKNRLRDIGEARIAVESDRVAEPAPQTAQPAPQKAESGRRGKLWLAAGGCVLAGVLATGLWPIDVPQVERVVPLTNDTTLKGDVGRLISDGNRVLYSDSDGADVWSVPASGGEPKSLSLPFLKGRKILADYSPMRQQILLASAFTGSSGGYEMWLAGSEGEAPRKIAELKPPSRAALAPDAERIAFSTPDGIYVQSIKNGERKRVHPMTGMSPTRPWWHPSGHSIGFQDPPNDQQKARAWQVNDDGTHLRRIVPETEHGQGLGAWSQDSRRFFYLGGEGEVFLRIQAGIMGWLRKPVVTRLTASGLFRSSSALAVDPVNPRRLYAVGTVLRGETMRFDRKTRRWASFLNGFSGEKIDRSPDGQWMAYVKFPGAELHRCRIDGSSDVLLAPGVEAMNPSWSPDGKQIAFSGRPVGTSVNSKLWLVSPSGGDAAPYPPGTESGYDTIWSGDGKRILLGQDNPGQSSIRIFHLKTGELEPIAGTERLFSPRWSPDEKQILALEVNTGKLVILDPAKGEWRPLTEKPFGYPKWSRDGKYIYGNIGSGAVGEAVRIEVATGRREEIARTDFKPIGNGGIWLGWTEDWEPLAVRDLSSTQVYRIDLDR